MNRNFLDRLLAFQERPGHRRPACLLWARAGGAGCQVITVSGYTVDLLYRDRPDRFAPFDRTVESAPALLIMQYSMARTLIERGFRPDALLGYSMGEIAAAALDIATFFCDACASWQKGAVENINGRLRLDLPRKIKIDTLCEDGLQDILLLHNLTPRKCLGYLTPAQALLPQLGLDIKVAFQGGVALHP